MNYNWRTPKRTSTNLADMGKRWPPRSD